MKATQSQEKGSKHDFLWKWILWSSVGVASGGVLLVILSTFPFYLTKNNSLILVMRAATSLAIGLPLGIMQWVLLKQRFDKARTTWWIFIYSIGIMGAFLIMTMQEYYDKSGSFTWVIVEWFIMGIAIGGLQWLVLRKLIVRGFWLIPLNLLALLGFAVCIGLGMLIDRLIYCLGIFIGGSLGGLLYGAIIGIQINKTREQPNIPDMTASGTQL